MTILINDTIISVPGLMVIPPASHGGPGWARLSPSDYRSRPGHPFQIMNHSTGGNWPQPILPGAGAPGLAARIADIWGSDPEHSGAHFLVDADGSVVQLVDAAAAEAYHAEGSNPYSVGIEMCVTRNGELYQATIDATVALNLALCEYLQIPTQTHSAVYAGEPLRRMETTINGVRRNTGGPDCVGIFCHRDNTSRRGRGDAGDAIVAALLAADVEGHDYSQSDDLQSGERRQLALNAMNARAGNLQRPLRADGIVGPKSMSAMQCLGFTRWRDIA